MHIVIPTYKRLNDQKTWNTIHPDLRQHITFVVRPEEAEHFRQHYRPSKVLVTDETVTNYNTTLVFILREIDGLFIYVDDDISAIYRRDRFYQDPDTLKKPFQCTKLTDAEGQRHFFNSLLSDLSIPYVGLVGCRPGYLPPYTSKYRHAQHSNCLVAINADLARQQGWVWGRTERSADLDFNLQVINSGYDCLQRNDFYFVEPGEGAGEGGVNSERYPGQKTKALQQLADLWPGVLVRKSRTPYTQAGKNGSARIETHPYRVERKRLLERRRRDLGLPTIQTCMERAADQELLELLLYT